METASDSRSDALLDKTVQLRTRERTYGTVACTACFGYPILFLKPFDGLQRERCEVARYFSFRIDGRVLCQELLEMRDGRT